MTRCCYGHAAVAPGVAAANAALAAHVVDLEVACLLAMIWGLHCVPTRAAPIATSRLLWQPRELNSLLWGQQQSCCIHSCNCRSSLWLLTGLLLLPFGGGLQQHDQFQLLRSMLEHGTMPFFGMKVVCCSQCPQP